MSSAEGEKPMSQHTEKEKQAQKAYEQSQRDILQKKVGSFAVETKNKIVSFLKKYITGQKVEDRKKILNDPYLKDDLDKRASDIDLQKQFTQILNAQAKGTPLTEEQQSLLAHISAKAATDAQAQKLLDQEVDPDKKITPSEKPKPNLATISVGALTPELLMQFDWSDYTMVDEGNGNRFLALKPSKMDKDSIRELFENRSKRKAASPIEGRTVIAASEIPPEVLEDPDFKKNYMPQVEGGKVFYVKVKRVAGGADDGGDDGGGHDAASVPDPIGGPEEEDRMETGEDIEELEAEEAYIREKIKEREEAERKMTEKEREDRRRQDVENEEVLRQYEERIRQAQAAQANLPPDLRGRGLNTQDIPNPPETAFIHPAVPEGMDSNSDEYKEMYNAALKRYNNAERRATELENARKSAIYLSMEIQAAESEDEVHWIIEEALRAGETDWASPENFQQAVNQVIQAVDLVFSGDQQRRTQFARLARARLSGYICEFTARFVNGGALAENITNYFQDYFEEMRDLPGVRRMMEIMEEADPDIEKDDDGNPLNIRGAYFRKLNYEKEDDPKAKEKRDEWYHYFAPKERSSKDGKWGVWVVDKKFKLFKEARAKKAGEKGLDNIKLDYVDRYSDNKDEELIRIILAKTQSNNNTVKTIKDLHRVVFDKEFYEKKGLSEVVDKDEAFSQFKHLDKDIIDRLRQNEKFKFAVRELTEEERKVRKALEQDKTTLSTEWGRPLDRMIYEINRAVTLGQRMEHSLQFSTHWDNLRWKKWDDMTPEQRELFKKAVAEINHKDHGTGRHEHDLDKYGRNTAGGLIILNPVVKWSMNNDPRYKGSLDKERKELREAIKKETDEKAREKLWAKLHKLTNEELTVNLRIAGEKRARKTLLKHQIEFEENEDRKKAMQSEIDALEKDLEIEAIDDMRGAKNHLFTIAVDQTYRDFYEKYWELIDIENSFAGDSSREARKAQFFGRTLEQSGEAEPGVRFMRRFADTGAKDIGMFFAFESAFDMIDNFTSVFNRVKRWSSVMKQGDKLRGVLMDMLNNPEILADPVKFTTEIRKNYRPHLSTDDTYDKEYYSEEEYFNAYHHLENQLSYVTGQWAEAILEFNKTHSWQIHSADLRQEVLTKAVAQMVGHELITANRAAHILDNQFGKLPKRIFYEITHVLLRPKEGMWALIMELLEESGKAFNQGLKAA